MRLSQMAKSNVRADMPWLLIDGGYLAYRALWSLRGDPVSQQRELIAFGMMDDLRCICCDSRCQSNRVAVFFDSADRVRRELFPKYKMNRKPKTFEEQEQKDFLHDSIHFAIKETFPVIGVPVYQKVGYEADDLIASACSGCGQAIVITADNDLYQLISDSVHWYNPHRRIYHTKSSFVDEKGISPSDWVKVKAIAGCSGDGIPGVGGVGEKTAIQYLLKTCSISLRRTNAIECPKGRAIIERNLKLVQLPYIGTGDINLSEPDWDARLFSMACNRYGLETFMEGERLACWKKIISGHFSVEGLQLKRKRK